MILVNGDVDPKGLRSLESLVREGVCHSADYFQQIDSTNTVALQELRAGTLDEALLPKCYLTDNQAAGRGRHGRQWISTDGTLTFSLVVEKPSIDARRTGLMSIAVGVGIARCLEFEFAPLNTRLKWPNDVHIGGGKVAGVLLETSPEASQRIVVGVGVNVANEPDLSQDPSGLQARSLTQVVGRAIHRYELFSPLVKHMLNAMSDMVDQPESVVDEFRQRCSLTGQRIAFQVGAVEQEGDCQGISETGELVVETTAGVRAVQSGEARLVRVREE
ncbi:MAG: biotin--[acetyl-CoA-carboxylase] ligase [Rubripirellula sp.]